LSPDFAEATLFTHGNFEDYAAAVFDFESPLGFESSLGVLGDVSFDSDFVSVVVPVVDAFVEFDDSDLLPPESPPDFPELEP
jgi:hypothetical protein